MRSEKEFRDGVYKKASDKLSARLKRTSVFMRVGYTAAAFAVCVFVSYFILSRSGFSSDTNEAGETSPVTVENVTTLKTDITTTDGGVSAESHGQTTTKSQETFYTSTTPPMYTTTTTRPPFVTTTTTTPQMTYTSTTTPKLTDETVYTTSPGGEEGEYLYSYCELNGSYYTTGAVQAKSREELILWAENSVPQEEMYKVKAMISAYKDELFERANVYGGFIMCKGDGSFSLTTEVYDGTLDIIYSSGEGEEVHAMLIFAECPKNTACVQSIKK